MVGRLPLGSVPGGVQGDSGLTSDNFSNFFDSLGDRNMGDGMSDSQLDEFEPYKVSLSWICYFVNGNGQRSVEFKQTTQDYDDFTLLFPI